MAFKRQHRLAASCVACLLAGECGAAHLRPAHDCRALLGQPPPVALDPLGLRRRAPLHRTHRQPSRLIGPCVQCLGRRLVG